MKRPTVAGDLPDGEGGGSVVRDPASQEGNGDWQQQCHVRSMMQELCAIQGVVWEPYCRDMGMAEKTQNSGL